MALQDVSSLLSQPCTLKSFPQRGGVSGPSAHLLSLSYGSFSCRQSEGLKVQYINLKTDRQTDVKHYLAMPTLDASGAAWCLLGVPFNSGTLAELSFFSEDNSTLSHSSCRLMLSVWMVRSIPFGFRLQWIAGVGKECAMSLQRKKAGEQQTE